MISVPPWMDYNLFEDILSKVLKEDKNVEVESFFLNKKMFEILVFRAKK